MDSATYGESRNVSRERYRNHGLYANGVLPGWQNLFGKRNEVCDLMYIEPALHIHSTLAEAKEFFNTYGRYYLWSDKARAGISDIAQAKRNLIIGEPGVGKTLLLSKLQEFLNTKGISNRLINLKDTNSISLIAEYLNSTGVADRALLLDGLDEVKGSLFSSILEKIEEVSSAAPDVAMYISSRSVFMSRYGTSFPEYRVITISPFTYEQVKEYLVAEGHRETEVDAFLGRIMSFSHNILVVQIPRYLSLLSKFLSKKQISSVAHLSRNEIFEYFIYEKLDLEDKRLNVGSRAAITKRLLEKIALTMEVYQANTLSKDELMTFLDDLESDLKLAALSQLDLQELFDKSLLKDNHDSIEFDNTEFQEYLAAKEITRFSDPRWAAFTFAVEPSIGEIHPSWFNALTFLVDMHPDLLEPLIEFSGFRGAKVADEGFIAFLSRIDPSRIKSDLKNTLFRDLLEYYHRVLQWIPVNLASFLPGIYDPSQEGLLKSEVTNSETEVGHKRFVPLGNVALMVGRLLEAGAIVDRGYWRKQLLRFAADDNDNGVLQRYALIALERLKDPTVISELPPSLMQSDELIVGALLTLCTQVAPESPVSMGYFFEATRRGEIHGRYGLYALKGKDALKTFLGTFYSDDTFRKAFLDKTSIFKDQDRVIAEHIEAACDQEMIELCKKVILRSFHFDFAHDAERSAFILGLGKLLKRKLPDFFPAMIEDIRTNHMPSGFFFTRSFFASLLDKEDIPQYLSTMTSAGEQMSAFGVMQTIKFSKRPGSEEIFEAGRPSLSEYYEQWDKERASPDPHKAAYERRILDEFRAHLEPAPEQFSMGLFAFYLDHAKELDPIISSENKSRLTLLITGSVLNKIDPIEYDLTATDERPGYIASYSISNNIPLFGDALRVADHLDVDVGQFRKRIINYIPFAYGDHLRSIFNLIDHITPSEMTPVLGIYKQQKSDLWRHMPSNLIDAVERYHIVDAVPVLRAFAQESAFPAYVRERAMTVVESLAPDKQFLKETVASYQSSTDPQDAAVATTALDLLITGHSDPVAIREKLRMVIERASPFAHIEGAHAVGPLEEEIVGGRRFARPLMKLKTRGFEQDYLALLDSATSLWAKGKDFYQYATYLWDIVYAYFDNLKEHGSYEPLQALEKKLTTIQDKEGSNWLLARMAQLRRSYLAYLGRPQNIAEAIRQYNRARHHDNKKIINSEDLHYQLKEVIETDLTRWIQAEGAYDLLLSGKVYRSKIQQYEKLVQKTLKSQIENILLKRGFQIEVLREPQLLDDKRTDLLIRYGFAGPVIVEVKLTSNTDMKMSKPEQSPSFISMKQYMKGYGASHGIFLIIDNGGARNLQGIQNAFAQIPNVWVKVFDYRKDKTAGSTRKKTPRKRRRAHVRKT
jgi:hypothetical protein